MRSGKSPKEFFKEMKKKPALQAILDNFDDYTAEQLENIQGQPLWIRQVLVELKTEHETGIDDEARMSAIEAIADQMMAAPIPQETPIKYDVFEYTGGDWYMSCGMTGSLKVDVKAGDCLYVIDCDHDIEKYILGMDSSVGILSKQQWFMFLRNGTFCGKMTKPEYAAFVSERLGKNFVDRDAIAKAAGPNSYVDPEESKKGFTIIRHDVK